MNNNILKSLLLFSILYIGATCAHSQSHEISLKNCSAKELIVFSYFKSLEPSKRYYEESKSVSEQAMKFIDSKKLDKNRSMSQLSTKDQLKLNLLLEKINAYTVRANIEKVNFRNLAVLIYMIQIIQDDDADIKDFLDKDPKITALFISMLKDWGSKDNNFQPPFYEVRNTNTCNLYTLAQQIQIEFFEKINASTDEIKDLVKNSDEIMKKVSDDKNGLKSLTPDERKKYNRMRDVFPKLASFRNNNERLEQLKSVAYVSDLKYENAVDVWERNLGNISTIDQSLQSKFSANQKYAKDFNRINNFLSLFEKMYPHQDFYESATQNPTELFKKK